MVSRHLVPMGGQGGRAGSGNCGPESPLVYGCRLNNYHTVQTSQGV